MGGAMNHWFHMDMNYRAAINRLVMCGCGGQTGGGWAHYVGQEKLRPQTGWAPLAFATATFGWRTTFLAVGAVTVVIGLPVWRIVRDDTPGGDSTPRRETPPEDRAGTRRVGRPARVARHAAGVQPRRPTAGVPPAHACGRTQQSDLRLVFPARNSLATGLAETTEWTRENLSTIDACIDRHRERLDPGMLT